MCASAIFVLGTSGIPPKVNYRCVKSYTVTKIMQVKNEFSSFICFYTSFFLFFIKES